MTATGVQHDETLARRVYAYFIFRLRQPHDAERLTKLTFERLWNEENLGVEPKHEPELQPFSAARAVIAENPHGRGATRVTRRPGGPGEDRAQSGLPDHLTLAMGRLHGRERDALALRFGAELSIGEIADLLDCTPADVKQRLARGVRMLIQLGALPKEGESESAAERPGTRGPEEPEAEQQ